MDNFENIDFEIIMASITGEDKPGLTSTLAAIIAKYNAEILDIGQADIHNSLSLGIMFRADMRDSGNILKEMLFASCELGVQIRFSPIDKEEYRGWVKKQGKNRHVITLLGRHISAKLISAVSRVLADQGLNIDSITRLTGRVPLEQDENLHGKTRACVEMSVRGTPKDREFLHSEF
ncbi:MAG: phosphoserine phosphatase SerB, partial [Bacteroidales bacterium]|nr:phosphoserine phosphatase SerB [Bacteroidales bacterium]